MSSPDAATPHDAELRDAFLRVLELSRSLPPDERLVMYDACDEGEVVAPLAPGVRKRLDPRRNTKPKKPNEQTLVCTPFNPNGFHFGKIKNEGEKLMRLTLHEGHGYTVLTNKFPLFPKHMLLVADALVPQQMKPVHLLSLAQLLAPLEGFCAYFNSWCASASVNHFHCHIIDEFPPVTTLELTQGPHVDGERCLVPSGYPGTCYVFPLSAAAKVAGLCEAMQADNQPHNLLLTPRYIYVWPKPLVRPARSFELYPETVGGPELLGSFTVYQQEDYDKLLAEHAEELARINTAPLPSRVLAPPHAVSSGAKRTGDEMSCYDDAAVPSSFMSETADGIAIRLNAQVKKAIPSSKSLDSALLPRAAAGWHGRRRDAGSGF